MNIDTPIRELGSIDVTDLRETILALEDVAWEEDQYRQDEYEVHTATKSILMIFVDTSRWPDIKVTREVGWDRLANVALPLMNEIIENHYSPGGTVIRAMAAKLLAGKNITPHWDKHPSFHCGHRIHVPITTNPRVRFNINGKPYRFKVGEAYEINNQKTHSVTNKGNEDRITFIFDYVPLGEIEKLPAAN